MGLFYQQVEQIPDHRKGGNNQKYELKDAFLGAFAVFFSQSPSFLHHQKKMEGQRGQSNAQSLFRIEETPSTPQVRNLLDPVAPTALYPLYRQVFEEALEAGTLDEYRAINNSLLVPLDGTQYFSSQKINCEGCNHRQLANDQTLYYHQVVTAMVVHPEQSQIWPLEPEFIQPQDGHEKQDCEIQATKRWLKRCGDFYAAHNITLLGDDLYAHYPFCRLALDKQFNFILTCKPDSHQTLYDWLDYLQAKPDESLPTLRQRLWNGQFGEIWTYRYINQVPLRNDEETLFVNWCELTITHEDTDEEIYHNAFVTNYEIDHHSVVEIVRDGRTRWKTENEGNNILKNQGYHFEHNFGHGQQYLSATLLTLNLLAFLFHTILHLVDQHYQLLREHLAARRTFFNDIRTLTRYLYFQSWDDLLAFMVKQLELEPLPPPS